MASSVWGIKEGLSAPSIRGQEFSLLAGIASLKATSGSSPDIQDLVIRALDRAQEFEAELPLLLALARDQGLFPYIGAMDSDGLPLPDLIAMEMHRPEGLEGVVFHRVQAEVYRKLLNGENVVLSAPTSFGKSLVMDAVIASDRYDNVVMLVPTLALIDEMRKRLSRKFEQFKVITHPGQEFAARNLFVLTQERYLAMENMPKVDFFFVDEFYKLNDTSTRSQLLNQSVYRLMKTDAQFYLAAPIIEALASSLPDNLRASLMITDYATVAADTYRVKAKHNKNDETRRAEIQRIIRENQGPTLIYCQSPGKARKVSRWLREDAPKGGYGVGMAEAAEWLRQNYSDNWTLPDSLEMGVGVHHGKLPRWLGPLMVKHFDDGQLGVLVCTSTLIEGVNTTAKNIIVLDKNISRDAYDFFTFANIRGRGGRMLKHFIGKIFLFNAPPPVELPCIDMPGISQSDEASSALLLSIDEEDRTDRSRERLRDVTEQTVLSEKTMRQNAGVDPEAQIRLAEHLMGLTRSELTKLQWTGQAPNWGELGPVIDLIWEYIPPQKGQRSHMATSARQLTFLTLQLAGCDGDIKQFIAKISNRDETDVPPEKRAEVLDERVEEAFDFIRFWIDHNLPTLIRALSRIAGEVLPQRSLVPGDFEAYASRMEAGFLNPLLLTAEEYGIPVQVSKKLVPVMPRYENLDDLIAGFKLVAGRTRMNRLGPFEKKLFLDAMTTL